MAAPSEGDASVTADRIETIVNTVQDGLYQLDTAGRFVMVNDVIVERSGYARDELLGNHAAMLMDDRDAERVEATIRQLLKSDEEVDTLDVTVVTASGERIPHELQISLLEEEGEFQGTVGAARDVSERVAYERRLERETEQAEAELDAVLGRASDAFFALDDEFQFRYVNEHAAMLFEASASELEGSVFWERFPDARDIDPLEDAFQAAIEEDEAAQLEVYYEPLGFWMDAAVYPSEIGVSVYFRDVTQRKEQERELERTHRRIELALEVTDATAWEWEFETDTVVTHPDPHGLHEAPIDSVDDFLRQVHPADRPRVKDALAAAIETGSTYHVEYRHQDGDDTRWIEDYGELVTDADGEYERLVGIARDITERKEHVRGLQRYETAVNATMDGIAVIGTDGSFRLVNEAFATGVGRSREELVGESIEELVADGIIDESVIETATATARDLLADEDADQAQFEATVESPVHGEMIVETNIAFLPPETDDQVVGGLIASSRPITERKRLKEELQRRVRQQEAVAELGRAAMESDDLDAFMEEATRAVAEVLDTEYCKILELDEDEAELALRAGTGWRDGLVGSASVPTDTGSQAGYTLISEEPVIVDDLAEESRFSGPELLTSHDVISGISVVIGSTDDPWGVLGTHDTERRTFSEFDADFVQSVANVIASAVERVERETALEESERRYRTLAEHFPNGVVALFDEELRYLAVGGELFDEVDVSPDEPIGQSVTERYPADLVDQIEPHFRAALDGERRTFDVEYLGRHLRGHTVPITDASGTVIEGMLMVQDVTEQRELEAALREREARYRDLFMSMTEGYCVIEKVETPPDEPIDFRYVEANPAFEEQTGISDVVGETIREVVPDEPQEWFDLYDGVIQSGEPVEFQRELESRGRILEGYAFPVGSESDERVGVIFTDVTDRVERERFLEDAKAQLEAATEAGAVGTWDWHIPSDTFQAGPSLARTFGVDPAKAREGVPLDTFTDRIHEDDIDRVMATIEEAMEGCGDYEAEYRVWDADGERRWVIARGHVECDEEGNPIRFPGALTDITDRKEYELALAARDRLHNVLRGIWQAAVAADSQDAIESQACDRLVELEPYAGAWIGRTEPGTEQLVIEAMAWSDGASEAAVAPGDIEDAVEPLGERALRTGDIQIASGADEETVEAEDSTGTAGSISLDRDGAIAAAPIVYEDIPHGALVVFAEGSDTFAGSDSEVIGELGEILGLTIAALDRKAALTSDQLVEFEVRLTDAIATFGVSEPGNGTVRFDRVIPVGDGALLLRGTTSDDGHETVEQFAEAADGIDHLEFLDDPDGEADEPRFEMRSGELPIFEPFMSRGGEIRKARLRDGDCHVVVRLAQAVDIHGIVDDLQAECGEVDVTAKRHVSRADHPIAMIESVVADELTDRQRAVLEAAHASGYFDWPRETTGEELAEAFDISPSTASQHLRLAQQKLLTAIFETDPDGQ